tara:strand:+ start:1008 stop:3215 length:2208 start_codon:yes stop_codon:yes gene_type:complete
MNIFFLPAIVLFTLVSSCSSLSSKQGLKITPLNSFNVVDGERSLEQIEKDLNVILSESPEEPSTRWWVKYKRAQAYREESPQKSCELFADLAKDEQFPLYHLAEIRSYEICPNSKRTNDLFGLQLSEAEEWLEDYKEDLAYQKAKELNNQEQIMHYALVQSKKSRIMHEKVNYTKEAIAAAKILKNKDQEKYLERRLYRLAPRLQKKYDREDWLKIAYDFRRARDFAKARIYYKKVLNHPRSTYIAKKRAFQGIIKVYKLQNDTRRYLLASEQWAAFTKRMYRQNKKSNYYQKELLYINMKVARSLWTKSQVTKARKLLEETAKILKDQQSLQEVYWLLARMEEEKENFEAAIAMADLALKEVKDSNEVLDKVLWVKAWNTRKLGRYQEAKESFQQLLDNTDEKHLQDKYSFWLAKTLQSLGEKRKAEKLFKKLTKEDPFGYYGLVAYAEIDEEIPHLRSKKGMDMEDLRLKASHSTESTLQWLIATNELEAARHLLKTIKFHKLNRDEVVKYLSYYKLAKDYRGMFVRMAYFDEEEQLELLAIDPEFFFPRPYYDIIVEASDKYGVSPEFILSIIRQESAFDPNARSHADAYGLMQVLPKEAFRIAAQHNIALNQTEDLYKPRINIPIGTSHLKTLRERFDNQFIISVASYNAAYTAVHGWLRTRYRGDALTFIEDIPYAETKGYVKLIFRNFMIYKRMNYAVDKIPFPHWAFDSLENYVKTYTSQISEEVSTN